MCCCLRCSVCFWILCTFLSLNWRLKTGFALGRFFTKLSVHDCGSPIPSRLGSTVLAAHVSVSKALNCYSVLDKPSLGE
ncbi:hypothetical protein M758_5G138000 [Ceratodon purpureus]|nr:hypothetical protein M758_5G138000 [Ceratodon purpureus]